MFVSNFVLPSLDCFGSSGLLWFHTNFRMSFPIFLKTPKQNLDRDYIESTDGFGLYEDFNNIHSPHARMRYLFVFLTFGASPFTFTKDLL